MRNQPAKWAAAIACRSLRELVYVWSSFPGVPLALHPKALLFRLLRRLGNASGIILSSKNPRLVNFFGILAVADEAPKFERDPLSGVFIAVIG